MPSPPSTIKSMALASAIVCSRPAGCMPPRCPPQTRTASGQARIQAADKPQASALPTLGRTPCPVSASIPMPHAPAGTHDQVDERAAGVRSAESRAHRRRRQATPRPQASAAAPPGAGPRRSRPHGPTWTRSHPGGSGRSTRTSARWRGRGQPVRYVPEATAARARAGASADGRPARPCRARTRCSPAALAVAGSGDEADARTAARPSTPASSTWTACSPTAPCSTRPPGRRSSTSSCSTWPRARAGSSSPSTLSPTTAATSTAARVSRASTASSRAADPLPEGRPDDPAHAETASALARRKGELIARGLEQQGVTALPGARRYLEAAGRAGLKRAVISASASTAPMLELATLATLVDAWVDAEVIHAEAVRTPPAPDLLLAACRRLDVRPEDAVTFTHSPAGVAAGVAAGLTVIGIGATPAEQEVLRGFGAERTVPALGVLLDRVLVRGRRRSRLTRDRSPAGRFRLLARVRRAAPRLRRRQARRAQPSLLDHRPADARRGPRPHRRRGGVRAGGGGAPGPFHPPPAPPARPQRPSQPGVRR